MPKLIDIAIKREMEKCNYSRIDEIRNKILKKCAWKNYGLIENCPFTYCYMTCEACWNCEVTTNA